MAEEAPAKRFGELVRRLRTEKVYSQEEFFFRVGLHQTYVSSVERGEDVTIQTADHGAAFLLGILFRQPHYSRDRSWRPSLH